jgi:uncharacterized membrane-anchored protein YhcB (DUF1043 family)
MTIQAWNLILNVVILVLLGFGGIWLKDIVDQQLKAKDATIEAFKATIKSHEAEIDRLKGETAPSIADAYQKMRTHAEQMTRDSQKLHTDLQTLAILLKRQSQKGMDSSSPQTN